MWLMLTKLQNLKRTNALGEQTLRSQDPRCRHGERRYRKHTQIAYNIILPFHYHRTTDSANALVGDILDSE